MVKKGVKMHLSEFQADEAFGPSSVGGSWADEDTQDVFANLPLPSAQGSRGGFDDDRAGGDWRSGGPRGDREPMYATRDPVPIPDAPPYTARLVNIDYSASETEIEELFSSDDFKTVAVRLPRDAATGRIRGSAFVEFSDRASLEKALTLDGTMFLKRPLRVLVAERREDDRFDGDWRSNRSGPLAPRGGPREGGSGRYGDQPDDLRDYDSWERRGPLPSRDDPHRGSGRGFREEPEDNRNYDSWERKGPLPTGGRREFSGPRRERREREFQPTVADLDDNWRTRKNAAAGGDNKASRPRLNLQPRKASGENTSTSSGPRSASLFGAAVPVDTARKEQEISDRQAKLDQQRHKKREEKEEKKIEQTRKGFEALSTEDDDEEDKEESSEPAAAADAAAAEKQEEPAAPAASAEELESGEWETVAKKGNAKK